MKLTKVFGVIIAAGLMATGAAMAQDAQATSGASDAQAPARPPAPRYGQWVGGPATTDADGIPVAKPNPISREEADGVLGGIGFAPGELTDDSNGYHQSSKSSQGESTQGY